METWRSVPELPTSSNPTGRHGWRLSSSPTRTSCSTPIQRYSELRETDRVSGIGGLRPVTTHFGPVLLDGFVLAFAAALQRRPSLHASCVVLDGAALVLAGHSGSGKSTTAAMLATDGWSLFADDVTAIETRADQLVAHRGSQHLRLRRAAWELGELMPDPVASLTTDDRLAVSSRGSTALGPAPRPIAAVLIPWPDREASTASIELVTGAHAAEQLLALGRLSDLRIPEIQVPFFKLACRIAETVPVGFLRMPWGPPWTSDLAELISKTIQAELDLGPPTKAAAA